MSGFDPERFLELMEIEEVTEVISAEVENAPIRVAESASEAAEQVNVEAIEKTAEETEKKPEPLTETEIVTERVVEEKILETVRERTLPAEDPEIMALYPKEQKAPEETAFEREPEKETAAGPDFRDWDRRWERESRRVDGGFPLY